MKIPYVNDAIDQLRATDYFQDLDESALKRVAEACEHVEVPRGHILFEEGQEGSSFYVLTYGRLGVWSGRRRVGEVMPGHCVGEMALLRDGKRSSTVKAERDCLLLRLDKKSFDLLLTEHPKSMLKLVLNVTDRLAGAHAHPPRIPRTIAIVPTVDHPEVERFCKALQNSMGKFRPTIWKKPPKKMPDRAWFNKQETKYGTVLYQCRTHLDEWSERCLRQADQMLLVGLADDPCDPNELENYWNQIHRREPSTHLVLFGFGKPKRTSKWLASRPDNIQVHHLEWNKPPDRIARFINQSAVGLVLGGGGARGLAHIGVFRALEERGIDFDLVGGTSMGGFAAALIASGRSSAEVEEALRWVWIDAGPFLDYNLPIYGLVKGQRVRDRLIKIFGKRHIEDLRRPFFCMTADITHAQSVIHDRGLLYRWITVGMSIPGVAAPYPHRGRLLMDGGLLNNLPVDIATFKGCGNIIAVNVDPKDEMAVNMKDFDGSHARQIWKQLTKDTTAPNIVEILVRVTTLTTAAAIGRMRHLIDHYIHPNTNLYGLFDFHMADAIIQSGYEAGMAYDFSAKPEDDPNAPWTSGLTEDL